MLERSAGCSAHDGSHAPQDPQDHIPWKGRHKHLGEPHKKQGHCHQDCNHPKEAPRPLFTVVQQPRPLGESDAICSAIAANILTVTIFVAISTPNGFAAGGTASQHSRFPNDRLILASLIYRRQPVADFCCLYQHMMCQAWQHARTNHRQCIAVHLLELHRLIQQQKRPPGITAWRPFCKNQWCRLSDSN